MANSKSLFPQAIRDQPLAMELRMKRNWHIMPFDVRNASAAEYRAANEFGGGGLTG